ncbi:MAG TPA: hypothetical protein LFW14_01015 [Rickettsia endosymbiont of Degeeriella rufa]|nr:hypothetical protein [Rickettsia endosymbiont of Columbicola hoogstraali]HJD62172.1 hypothetical protein [Rickettsia endosymbiont of Degeeriella rufa]
MYSFNSLYCFSSVFTKYAPTSFNISFTSSLPFPTFNISFSATGGYRCAGILRPTCMPTIFAIASLNLLSLSKADCITSEIFTSSVSLYESKTF